MKKSVLLEFIKKHTKEITKARWISNSKDKTLKANVAADTRNLLVDLTLKNWDGWVDAEIGIGDMVKFNKELSGIYDEDVTCLLNQNDDKTRIISVDFTDSGSVGTFTTSDLDMIGPVSKLKSNPPVSAEIVFDEEMRGRFLKAKAALPDVNTFTIMMNKKDVLELVVGYSKINSSRFSIKVKTQDGKDKVDEPLHFRADYLAEILSVNSECGDSILKVSNNGLCSIEFSAGDFETKYYLTSTDDQD